MVATFWIWTEPTSRAASFSPSKAGGRAASRISVQVTAAPIRQPDPVAGNAPQLADPGKIQHIIRFKAIIPKGGKMVRTSCQRSDRMPGAQGKRFLHAFGGEIHAAILRASQTQKLAYPALDWGSAGIFRRDLLRPNAKN